MQASVLAALCGAALVRAIPTIEAVGNKFFTSEGEQFFIRGVAYQLLPDDPLIDTEQCTRDASLMKELGANTIRVYHVDPEAEHDGCMKAFADAGIYAMVDMDTFNSYIMPVSIESRATVYILLVMLISVHLGRLVVEPNATGCVFQGHGRVP